MFSKNQLFQLSTPDTKICLSIAERLQKWAATEHNTVFTSFADQLVQKIKGVIKCTPDSKVKREKMWANFFNLVTSSEFKKLWDNVTEASESLKSSLFYFYVTFCIFQEHLQSKCSDSATPDLPAAPKLTLDEENALQYIGGYIIRALEKRLSKKRGSEVKIACLHSFLEETEFETVADQPAGDIDVDDFRVWTNALDRGGLYHCKADFFLFLHAVEIAMKVAIAEEGAVLADGFVARARKNVISNEDVLFWWECAVTTVSSDIAVQLLHDIVQLHITIRGFAFTAKWIENYKQKNKLTIQKSRSLRTKLRTKLQQPSRAQ